MLCHKDCLKNKRDVQHKNSYFIVLNTNVHENMKTNEKLDMYERNEGKQMSEIRITDRGIMVCSKRTSLLGAWEVRMGPWG